LLTATRITLACLLATVALAAAACGGGSDSVPSGAIAVVDGTEISKTDLDELIAQAKKGYESQSQQFPKAGTPEYQSIQTQYVAYLVELEELRQAAEELGVSITEEDLDAAEKKLIDDRFEGKRAEYEKALEQQGFTAEQYRENALEVSALSTKIFDVVTKGVKVTEQEILEYYTQNQSQYGTPESRDVRHILIAEKDGDTVDFEASKAKADAIYAQLEGGADFAALAKENSADPGSKDSGGKLTISRGQTVPEFDQVSFELDEGELSKPVKTTYGYHVIEAVSEVRKATATPIDKVKPTIRATLLQQKRNEEMQAWVEDLKADYEGKVSYAVGYEPPALPETPTETQ
jgi:foldase protein PrsA